MGLGVEITDALSLDGRVAVVTGAGSGLGREAARLLSVAGARVVLADIDRAGLEVTAGSARQAGGDPVILPTDVTDPEAVDALADGALRECGRLDIWINCAGITLTAGILEGARKDFDKVVAVNMMGSYHGCAAAGRVMKAQGRGGAIINISSTAGESPVPQLSAYCMTKGAVNQLTKVAAVEFGAFGVRVNAVVPGFIDTPIYDPMYQDDAGRLDPAKREAMLTQVRAVSPIGLAGEPTDIAFALLYLASDASRFVTGAFLRVSGGV